MCQQSVNGGACELLSTVSGELLAVVPEELLLKLLGCPVCCSYFFSVSYCSVLFLIVLALASVPQGRSEATLFTSAFGFRSALATLSQSEATERTNINNNEQISTNFFSKHQTSLTLCVTFVDTFLQCAFALSIDNQYDIKKRCHFDTFFR